MTPQRLPTDLSGRDVREALQRAEFKFDRQRGSHMVLFHEQPHFVVVVPDHKELRIGTLRKVIRDARMTVNEFLSYL